MAGLGFAPTEEQVEETQDEFKEELAHWVCTTCNPLNPAKAMCGTTTTQAASSEHMPCVVCEYMVTLPCERCGE